MRIAFIGGGNMATALIGGLLQRGFAASDMTVVEIQDEARTRLEQRFGVSTAAAISADLGAAEVLVLAVKPQQMREVARGLQPCIGKQLVITIAAGIRCDDLSRWLGGYGRLVRAMPNTPALVQSAITGLFAAAGAHAEDRARAERILSAVGDTLWLDQESQLDAITAVSGSGPAYVFYFMESLQQAAESLGFSTEHARKLAQATFAGAVKLAGDSDEPPATLRARVTSKAGTTERALQALEGDGVREAVVRAVSMAERRSRELGDEFGKQ
jgi:pyrroline-5-carboxylate reductase